jgi:hypothetical protein
MLKRNIKTIYNFANASLFFWLFMIATTAVISFITVIDTTTPVWQWIEFITHTAGLLGLCSLILCVSVMLNDFVEKQETDSGQKYSESEIGFTRIQRDEEGEEIKRDHYKITVHHNLPRRSLEKALKIWQTFESEKDDNADFSAGSFCRYVNQYTNYIAAETEDEFLKQIAKNL